ncbi:MAG: DUF3300 domain-containing protein [Nitrospiria bacterium]
MKKLFQVSLVTFFIVFELLISRTMNTKHSWINATVQAEEYTSDENYSPDQLDNLLAPIALYPDPILAQVLLAATFVDQVDEASRWMRANNNPDAIDYQAWDVSVKAIAHYPPILEMMSDQLDWTTAVGQAYVNQPQDVMISIQGLRAQALKLGNLVTNDQQEVVVEGNDILIVPIQPDVIYVPSYDPDTIYSHPASYFEDIDPGDLISFGEGMPIGVWLIFDFNWHNHLIYYHGWKGRGWVVRSRSHVQITNAVYVNTNYRKIQIDRNIVDRNVNSNNLSRFSSIHHDVTYNSLARKIPDDISLKPSTSNKLIRRNVDINDARIQFFRGHAQEQLPVHQATESMQKKENFIPEPQGRTERTPIPQQEPSQNSQTTPYPQPGNGKQHPYSVFGGNRSGFDSQAIIQRGQSSRSLANQPANRPVQNMPEPHLNPSGGGQGRRP